MPRLMTEDDVDPGAGELDLETDDIDLGPPGPGPGDKVPDLTDGGRITVGRINADLYPTIDGVRQEKGRVTVRRAWAWDGTETTLPLAYAPGGKSHDYARPYLSKMHCLCCGYSGFRGKCLQCVKNQCTRCKGSTERTKLIRNFYLKKQQVPFPARFYGPIGCFLSVCARKGEYGFKTQEEANTHGRLRHRMQYQSHLEALATSRDDELTSLRRRLDALQSPASNGQHEQVRDQKQRPRRKKAAVRSAKASPSIRGQEPNEGVTGG